MIERPSFLTPCLSRDAVRAQESEDLDSFLGGISALFFCFGHLQVWTDTSARPTKAVLRGCPKFSGLSKYPPRLERFS